MGMFLTHAELIEMTGRKRPTAIARFLRENGLKFIVGADGWPRVLRSHLAKLMGGEDAADRAQSQPNASALRQLIRSA